MDARAGETMYLYEKVGLALELLGLWIFSQYKIDTFVSRTFRRHGIISIHVIYLAF